MHVMYHMCSKNAIPSKHKHIQQWRAQKIFMGVFIRSVAYDGHFHLVCDVCDVTISRPFHGSRPTFWRSVL